MTPTDIDTFRGLHACSTPELWAAFMALARYLTANPEQRLGQAVINALTPEVKSALACIVGAVIEHTVPLERATRYVTDEAAFRAFDSATARGDK